jgi:hypothetical protein
MKQSSKIFGEQACDRVGRTTGFRAFAESRVPLGEGPFPLGEGFTESELSAKASRHNDVGEALFDESCRSSSRWMFAERPIWLSVKKNS